jgi:dolichol-phosphate mannosyltransferase
MPPAGRDGEGTPDASPDADAAAPPCLIVVPTYNEAENLERLLAEIHCALPRAHVLVVDDSSPDGTGRMAEGIARHDRRVHVLHRPAKQGLGTAYVAGYRWALERDYAAVVQMDADFSHDPRFLPAMLGALSHSDLVIGSRYVNGISVVNWSLGRLVISLCGCFYARTLTRLPVRDVTGGFKVWRAALLRQVPLHRIRSNGYAFQIEMNFWAYRLGGRVVEYPIIFVDRRVGVSKMDSGIVAEATLTPFRLWLDWLRRR